MIYFDDKIKRILLDYISKDSQFVESIVLASSGFNIAFTDFNIQCNETVIGYIDKIQYEWDDAPNAGPWGALGRQRAIGVNIQSPNFLRITFESGDYLDIETCESHYESVIFTFPPENQCHVMEIY
ncbi:hypothetical protein [Pseudoalteromonas sp. T1lg122]|uniref:hypothetical protein n=1 Tax=Pseudoalteromonas sp. T1lg122 TaxID=2077094 RepID=UPI000CF670D7|nr:hypothetical protein [Pseudoalteromonas sp. T1lg122]